MACTQTDAALAEFTGATSMGARVDWFERYAPTYRDIVSQVRGVLVADLLAGAEDGLLAGAEDGLLVRTDMPVCPSKDDVVRALWWRGVRPEPTEADRLAQALRARALEAADEPDLGASRDEVIDAARRGELPLAALAEHDRRLAAAWQESVMERLRCLMDEVCRAEWTT